jgi:hypothetical protein
MPTDLENLLTRRSAILAELAAGPSKPSYTIDGQSVDWNGYRSSLLNELTMLNGQIAAAEGPWEIESRGMT